MRYKKECIAMLLAGGQGSRLGLLTKSLAKPAVPFGGKYRIIDFPLSNCANSGIDTVGVLTQYQPLELNSYIGTGQPWDLDLSYGGVYVLPPYMTGKTGQWYSGTANAICQNIPFIKQYDPEYVLVLSGDHIYKMDYSKMLDFHKANHADVTIAVRTVPWEVTNQFGIMNTDANSRILEFEEKPKNAKSNLASMGVYIFSWKLMQQYLLEDDADPNSENDFGKNIIPKMLADGRTLMAYQFDSYWKDVGTIASLWESNMDLLQNPPVFDLQDEKWRIFARNPIMPPHYTSAEAVVQSSMVTEGCEVCGAVYHSVLFAGVIVEEGALVEDSVVMPNTVIKKNAKLKRCIVGEDAVIGEAASIGEAEGAIALVASDTLLPEGYVVHAGEQIGNAQLAEKEAQAK